MMRFRFAGAVIDSQIANGEGANLSRRSTGAIGRARDGRNYRSASGTR
jgi:hypothetical protein